ASAGAAGMSGGDGAVASGDSGTEREGTDGGAGGATAGAGVTADGALVDVAADVPTTCAACTLVASASWDKSDTFVTDGHEVFWRGGRQSSPMFAVGVDGTNRRSFTVTGCPDLQGGSRLYA